MRKRLALLFLALWIAGCSRPGDGGIRSERAGAGPLAAPGEEKEPSQKTREAVQNLKADLAAFEVTIYTWPPLTPGGPGGDPEGVQLVADPKKVPAKGKGVFPITEKQAVALIDYLADSGMFDRVPVPPAGILAPGWYVAVTGGRPPPGRTVNWRYQWPHGLDVQPATVGVIQHLTKSLDGDARVAVEGFRKDVDKTKR